jgi:hypothetical protein
MAYVCYTHAAVYVSQGVRVCLSEAAAERREAKRSQAKPTALGSCFPYFVMAGCDGVVAICCVP